MHDPAAARFEVKSIERTPEGATTAQLRVDSPNPQDNDRLITIDARALARMPPAYAGTFS
ncbi:hypothetical protein WT09_24260 [Burkholderia stagnalis]|nr:hypothetical protein WT09_24260 [Burkholderia stagnalis]